MYCSVVLLPLLVGLVHNVQADQCNDVKKEFNQCTKTAHQTYLDALRAKEDGRPFYRARKTCDYLSDAVETCGNKLMQHDCNSEKNVNAMKAAQISKVLENLGESVANFDSCKCPPVKYHMDRVKLAQGVALTECLVELEHASNGASSVLASLLLPLLLLVVHQL